MHWLCGSLASLDAHLPRPGWRREDLGLPTGQGTLTVLQTGKGGGKEWEVGEGNGSMGGHRNFFKKGKDQKSKDRQRAQLMYTVCLAFLKT